MVWAIGFLVYRYLMNIDMILGNTLPDMLITMGVCFVYGRITRKPGHGQGQGFKEGI